MKVNFLNQIENIVSEYHDKDKIYIIGKGPSIQNINTDKLNDGLIINLNDSERIVKGHFTILHSSWAYHSVSENNFKSKCYISDYSFPDEVNSIKVEYRPDSIDSFESILSAVQKDDFYISDILLVTAIRLAKLIANVKGKKTKVYMLGFDFGGVQSKVINDYSHHDDTFKYVFLKKQEEFFIRIKDYYKSSTEELLDIIHVGSYTYSDVSLSAFNNEFLLKSKKIDERTLKNAKDRYEELVKSTDKGHTIIVAEFTNNHIGDPDRLVKMVELAKKSGADLIKVQKRNVDSFYTQVELNSPYKSPFGTTLGEYRRGVELSSNHFNLLSEVCDYFDISWFASILDKKSFEFLSTYKPPLLKLPSTISNHRNYLKSIAENYDGDFVISTGYTGKEYEDFILNNFLRNNRLFLMQCTSSYPTPPEACQIAVVRHYSELNASSYMNLYPGYSSHDIGSLGCMMAVAAGAKIIEKHVKLGDLDWVHFDGVAIDLYNNNFKSFVDDIRKAESMTGGKIKKVHDAEHHKYVPNDQHN